MHPLPPPGDAPALTVLITTRNRRAELLRALASVTAQSVAAEVIVMDDASEDGTAQTVAEAYPAVRVERSQERRGLIAQRNTGIALARTPLVCLLDDDAELTGPRTLETALARFDDARIAVVALALTEHGNLRGGGAPDGTATYVTDTFAGGACLLRADVFTTLGGFRSLLFYGGEDSDYARRLYASGHVVALCEAPPVTHHVSRARERERDVYFHTRAQIIVTALGLPWRTLPRRAVLGLGYAVKHRHPWAGVRGTVAGLRATGRARALRQPVSGAVARLLRRMERERVGVGGVGARRYTMTLERIAPGLPPLTDGRGTGAG